MPFEVHSRVLTQINGQALRILLRQTFWIAVMWTRLRVGLVLYRMALPGAGPTRLQHPGQQRELQAPGRGLRLG